MNRAIGEDRHFVGRGGSVDNLAEAAAAAARGPGLAEQALDTQDVARVLGANQSPSSFDAPYTLSGAGRLPRCRAVRGAVEHEVGAVVDEGRTGTRGRARQMRSTAKALT